MRTVDLIKLFEIWISGAYEDVPLTRASRDVRAYRGDLYEDDRVQGLWQAWQEGRTSTIRNPIGPEQKKAQDEKEPRQGGES